MTPPATAASGSAQVTLWVLGIDHRHGTDTFIHRTKQGAEEHVVGYVDEWWDTEFPGVAAPDDEQDRVREYFERMESESYILTEAAVLP